MSLALRPRDDVVHVHLGILAGRNCAPVARLDKDAAANFGGNCRSFVHGRFLPLKRSILRLETCSQPGFPESKVKHIATRMLEEFTRKEPVEAAYTVVTAIRSQDWLSLDRLLANNPGAVGRVSAWRDATPQPEILDSPEVQTLPTVMVRYPGRTLVRFPLKARYEGQKLEVIVESHSEGFSVIDFWGFGWP